ncbi:MAG TPA: DUF92 domain-containing protein [Candidatus Baltobacteraceae bacterium]|nr:DUF92 domain-containing protein [Candidatus Baltobacteraceae bacterium]
MGLTQRGWIAALAVGACTLAGGGWRFALVLLAFFLSSMALSRVGRKQKAAITTAGKHGPRDEWQVLANGGIAAGCALVAAATHRELAAAAFAGAFAAANADTWATEIGTLANGVPRSILTWRPLPTGLSGGITAAGTLAQVAGAVAVGAVAGVLGIAPWWAVAAGGVAGSLADSVAGAALQERRYCPQCRIECETDPHACGTATALAGGTPWLKNDGVNFVCTALGAVVGAVLTVR